MEAAAAEAAAAAETPQPQSNTQGAGGGQQPQSQDICRVCRCEASADRPLFHPCICTGSIKYIHQECLLQWLRYSKKEFCELCNHRFSFTPIYSPDMPNRLPLRIVLSGFLSTVAHAVRFWMHYTLVALAWLGVVPLTACRIYRTLFTGSVSNILSLPINVFSTDNITADILQGCAVVTLTLLAFIGLVWLREQILHGGGPEWLEADFDPHHQHEQEVGGEAQGGAEERAAAEGAGGQEEGEEEEDDDAAEGPADHLPAEPEGPPMEGAEAQEDDVGGGGNAEGANNQADNEGNLGEEGQWNPMEWDRAAEELTWERLLGLDGSLVFLEHVFWVVSLNTLFVLVFAFCPYHIGHFTVVGFHLKPLVSGAHFEGMLITLCGYCVIAFSLVIIHGFVTLLNFRRTARLLGLCYVVVKVSLLLVIEIVAFPVICGWWLDICSLALFDASLKDRQASYHNSPYASMFIHWLVGMVYVFYFASFVILLREVLRPGVLWFLRNLNDPDFNPIQEMIHLSIARHLRRFCASLVMFGTSILVMLYVPSRIIKHTFPTFLPYQTSQLTESQVDELAMELLLLLVILPAVQDQNHTREWLKTLIRAWCTAAAWALDLRSYLFGDVPLDHQEDHNATEPQDNPDGNDAIEDRLDQLQGGGGEGGRLIAQEIHAAAQVPLAGEDHAAQQQQQLQPPPLAAVGAGADAGVDAAGLDLGAAQQALLPREGPTGFQPYLRPSYFALRIAGLMALTLLSWLVASLASMLAPVWIGRQIFRLLLSDNSRVYELYTAATGIYVCLLFMKGGFMVSGWVQQGWAQLSTKIREWTYMGLKASVALFLLVGVIPLLFGFLLEVVILMPVRVPLYQSPVYFPWQDWALGAMYTKISIALTFMGPDWWMKTAIERLYQDGLRNLNLSYLIPHLVLPVCTTLGLSLALPYLTAHSLAPLVLADPAVLVTIQRRIYPFLLILFAAVGLAVLQLKQFRKLYEHIKNDRYLVGRRLVNYNHPSPPPAATAAAASAATSAAAAAAAANAAGAGTQ